MRSRVQAPCLGVRSLRGGTTFSSSGGTCFYDGVYFCNAKRKSPVVSRGSASGLATGRGCALMPRSTTTSVLGLIKIRCSLSSRRTNTRRRRASTVTDSRTVRRFAPPCVFGAPGTSPKRRAAKAQIPMRPSTKRAQRQSANSQRTPSKVPCNLFEYGTVFRMRENSSRGRLIRFMTGRVTLRSHL